MFNPPPIPEQIKQILINLIEKQTGLKIRMSEEESFVKKIQDRLKILHLNSAEEYYYLLNKLDFISQNEWKELATIITNTESYFFRDQGQFLLLKNHLLPDLIKRKKAQKHLRIWSAGCSTGEEPYSLAILLQELIEDIDQWNLNLLATDLNQNAIEKAKQGIYSPWSFRSLDEKIIKKYFHKINHNYQINANIRHMTQFEILNLKTDYFPQTHGLINNFDLIICRNVFIYFSKETIGLILEKFIKTLNNLGYLLTGHAELYGQNLSDLETKIFQESIVYQKPETIFKTDNYPLPNYPLNPVNLEVNSPTIEPKIPKTNPTFNSQTSDPNLSKLSESNLLNLAQEQFNHKQYTLSLKMVDQALKINSKSLKGYYLKAKILANMAQYHEAKKYCQKIINLDPFYLKVYYLLAEIAEETQDIESAKTYFKKIIYLDNSAITAYLGMAYLYRQESNLEKSKKMYQTALSILKKMKPSLPIEGHHLTSTELCLQIEKELSLLGA